MIMCFGTFLAAQVVYVDADATGNGDGSSWSDAFTTLDAALDAAESGDALWIADGTYIPADGANDTLYYTIDRDLALYGGFAGTETSLAERDPSQDPTIISGDAAGDDTAGEFVLNKGDNLRKLFVVDSMLSRVTFDRLTFTGADAETDEDNFPNFWTRGAAVYARSPVTVNDCVFSGNRAARGAGVYVLQDADGSVFTGNTFTQSAATSRAIGVYAFEVDEIEIADCVFTNNPAALRGGIHLFRSNNSTVDNCQFSDNVSTGFGASIYSWNGLNLRLTNSVFENSAAANATAIYLDGRENDTLNLVVENCVFRNNTVSSRGAGLFNANGVAVISNCTFEGNRSADSRGAAIYSSGASRNTLRACSVVQNESNGSGGAISLVDDAVMNVDSCQFEGNESVNFWGGVMAMYGDSATITNSRFFRNAANRNGGALTVGFQGVLRVDNCEFIDNNATGSGGAINTQNDTTQLWVSNSFFDQNNAGGSGGALNVTNGTTARIDRSVIQQNLAELGAGANFIGDSALIDDIRVSNTLFTNNIAGNQGGAINTNNVNDMVLENVIAVVNVAENDGIGAFLSNNASAASVSTLTLRNCTVTENTGLASIMQWEADSTAQASISLLNTLVISGVDNYAIEQGTPSVVSLGGNVVTDASLGDLLTEATDQVTDGTDVFTDPGAGDFTLADGGVGVDAGVDDGNLPDTDYAGNPRVQGGAVDAGAFETAPVGTYDAALLDHLSLSPNPTPGLLTITLDDPTLTRGSLRVYDAQQRLLHVQPLGSTITQTLDLSALPRGSYRVVLQLTDRHASRIIIKQ